MLLHYAKAKNTFGEKETDIVDAIERRKVPSVRELKEKLDQLGMVESKLTKYFNEAH